MIIGIVGAGASGLAAAIEASMNTNNQIIVFERQARVGRKLQATGNGRCNLSNTRVSIAHYHGNQPDFAEYALNKYNVENTLDWFHELGLYTVTEESGKIYPYSDQANSVVDILRFSLERPNIELRAGVEVQRIKRQNNGFIIDLDDAQVYCDRLVVACGGLAGTKLGGSMFGYKLLSKMGHKSTRLRPALVQLKTDWNSNAALKGVRTNCKIQIFKDDVLYSESKGELQFTEYGLSGPVVFEISRDVCSAPGQWFAVIDFVPDMSKEQLLDALRRRKSKNITVSDLLTGILHNRLGRILTQAAGLGSLASVSDLCDDQLLEVCRCVKGFKISILEPMGMDSAQVTAGGIETCQFNPKTMESKLVPGLFACGEVLDIDGDCGGFNLQWAWSSGRLAGYCAGKE